MGSLRAGEPVQVICGDDYRGSWRSRGEGRLGAVPAKQKAPTEAGAFHYKQRGPETGIEPATSRLRLQINDGLAAGCISLISDSANEIDDLFDLDASLIRLIVRSQTGLRKLLH